MQAPIHFSKSLIASSLCLFLLTACGTGSNNPTSAKDDPVPVPTPAPDQPQDPHAASKGRLAISDANNAVVRLIELDTQETLGDFPLLNTASALAASPDSRYLLAFQRSQNKVQFIDSGLSQRAHGDHYDTVKQAPALLSYSIDGVKPTHFDLVGDQAALFLDGNKSTGINASFQVLSDASIANSAPVASHEFANAMHGTAQLRGQHVLTTAISENATGTSPDSVVLLHQHNDHYHQGEVFAELCPGLHGSFQGPDWTVFGCTDGVLSIKQDGDKFTASKLANPAGLAEGIRIGTIKGSHGHDKFLGLTRTQQAFLIDPAAASMEEIHWKSGPEISYLAYGVDHHQEHFLMLDSAGELNVFEIKQDFTFITRFKLFDVVPTLTGKQRFVMTSSGSNHHVYISNPVDKQLLVVDLEAKKVTSTIDLEFEPNKLAWLGIENK